MDMDSRTIVFLAVTAFMSLLLLCCIILSILFYVRYRNTEICKDDKEKDERERIKKLKERLMKQFRNELKKQTTKRLKHGKVAPAIVPDDIERACSICLDSLADDDTSDSVLALLIHCGHVYHMDCVWPWLERDHSCPICRHELELSLSDLKAVTVHHVLNNFDIPSIRESVSRCDLQSHMNYECLEVVSVNEDDIKTLEQSPRIITVMAADDTRSLTMAGVSGVSVTNESIHNSSIMSNPSLYSTSLNPSLIVNMESLTHNGSIVNQNGSMMVSNGLVVNPSVTNITFAVSAEIVGTSEV